MRTNSMRLVSSALLAFALISLARPSQAVVLDFGQLDWLDGGGGYTSQDSDWGHAVFDFSSSDIGSFTFTGSEYIGYLNLVTDTTSFGGSANNWAVQNLPIVFQNTLEFDEDLPYEVRFSLSTLAGVDVTSMNFLFSIDSSPLFSAPVGSMSSIGVANRDILIGFSDDQFSEGGAFQQNPPAAQNFAGAPGGTIVTNHSRIVGTQTNLPSVAEDVNGCAPGAAARSIAYLGLRAGVPVTTNAQTIYNDLRSSNYMNTSIGTNGTGTAITNFISGKDRYFISNGLPIAPTVVTNNFAAAMQALRQTGDVEMGVFWGYRVQAGVTSSLGGHAVMVTGVNEIRSNNTVIGYTVNYIDDTEQGDGIATNNQGVLRFDAAGNMLGAGLFAGLNSFRIEMATIPEPSILGFAALGAAIMAICRRRR